MDGKHLPKNPTDRNKFLTQLHVFELAVFLHLFLNFIYNIMQATQSIHCWHNIYIKIRQVIPNTGNASCLPLCLDLQIYAVEIRVYAILILKRWHLMHAAQQSSVNYRLLNADIFW